MGILTEAIQQEIGGDFSLDRLFKVYGGGKRGRIAATRALAGTNDSTSRAYKSAQRNFEGWENNAKGVKKGTRSNRKISLESQKKLNILGGKKLDPHPSHIMLDGDITVGSEKRKRIIYKIPPDPEVITDEQWEALVKAAYEPRRKGEKEEAAQKRGEEKAWDIVAEMYHVGFMDMEVGSIRFLYD